MSWNNHRIFGAAGVAGALGTAYLLSGVAVAQQAAAPAGENTLTEIIVTAQKRPELLRTCRSP